MIVKRTLEEYLTHIVTLDGKFHNTLQKFKQAEPTRNALLKQFPYRITMGGYCDYDGDLVNMEIWCYEQFGFRHGECETHYCEYSYENWCKKNGFDEILDREIDYLIKNGQRDKTHQAIENHSAYLRTLQNCPDDHSHIGTWTTLFLFKSGYDYGYQDYYFKHKADAVLFQLQWKGK